MTTLYAGLHNQTHYSLLDSIISPKDLFIRAKELNYTAVAIVDHGSLAGLWESAKYSKETGVKLIVGCECYFQDNVEDKLRHIVLLAKNAIGYKNLLTINKKGFDQSSLLGKRVYSVIDWKILEDHSEGLICLTACGNGIISQLLSNGKFDEAEAALLRLKSIFNDNLGVEIQPNNMDRGSNFYSDKIDQRFLNRRLIDLGKKHNIRIVAACNAHYLKKEDHEVHDVLLAVGAHQPVFSNFRLKYPVPDFYLKSGDEVKAFFSRNFGEEFAEEVCSNSVHFASLCEVPDWINPKFSNSTGTEFPVFPVKDEECYSDFCAWLKDQSEKIQKLDEDKAFLRYKCSISFKSFLEKNSLSDDNKKIYEERLEEELDVLEYQGFSSYMLIVADFIDWARKNNISCGPGRGSAGGSLIGYLINIHQADPIKYGLIFARFQNKEKTSMPDIDSDIATSGRDRVYQYIETKYGKDNVASISNINRITPKVYARDVSRSCELGGGKDEAVAIGNMVADIIPKDAKSAKDLFDTPLFYEFIKKYPELEKNIAILNKPRAFSTHAAAAVISKRSLVGLVPLRKDKNGSWAIEYDKDDVEENGLIKMDLLGLSTLDVIDKTISLIKENNKPFNNEHLNYDAADKKTYDLITSGNTYGVFQFGTSGGTVELCKKIKPKTIEDLAIITTLARPAAANIRSEFIETREGKRKCQLLHPSLHNAFAKTFGYGLYDESILKLGQDVAGWNLNEADKLRKMIKNKGKNPEQDKKLGEKFIKGAVSNGIDEAIAVRIWNEEIAKFASYTFNLSHAIMYSFISYQTAYLKANYPVEFLMANLMAEVKSNTPDAKSNIDKIKNELRLLKVNLIPPDLNKSQLSYVIKDNKILKKQEILTGFDALKFVGDDAIKDIIEKRPFSSFLDFMARVDSRKVRANTIQALAIVGCLDSFGIDRKLIYYYCSDYRKKLQIWLKKHDPAKEQFVYPFPTNEEKWKISDIYALEQFYLGESFICKAPEAYGKFFKQEHKTIKDIKSVKDKTKLYPVKAIIRNFFEFKVKKETSKYYGQPMVKAIIEDVYGEQCSCTIFPDRWKLIGKRLKEINSKAVFDNGLAISFIGTTNNYEDDIGIILEDLFDIALVPPVPSDLKAKKVSLKESKETKVKGVFFAPKDGVAELKDLFSEIEDNLYFEGLIDLDEEIE